MCVVVLLMMIALLLAEDKKANFVCVRVCVCVCVCVCVRVPGVRDVSAGPVRPHYGQQAHHRGELQVQEQGAFPSAHVLLPREEGTADHLHYLSSSAPSGTMCRLIQACKMTE